MRWLLIKDLQILRRSPLLVALLVLYPVVVALLIGFAFSRGPDRPKVAVANEIPAGEPLEVGGRQLDILKPGSNLFQGIDVIQTKSRAEAIKKVENGEALGAVVIPNDFASNLAGGLFADQAHLDVYVNEEDPLKARLVDDAIKSLLAEANKQIARTFTKASLKYLGIVLKGGSVDVGGANFEILGLKKTEQIARAAQAKVPKSSKVHDDLDRVIRFSQLAQEGLDLTDNVLSRVAEPVVLQKNNLSNTTVPLTSFAAAVAVALSLAFVAVLLAAGSLALERSENTFGRLVRGPVTREKLLAEKIVLAAASSAVVTFVMLLVMSLFIPLEWGRLALWLVALVVAAAAFSAMGTAIGAIARDVAVASLMAFALILPIAFLALVPSGVVSSTLHDLARVVSALFPFRPTIKLMSSALYDEGGFVLPLIHLIVLTAGFGVVARLALKRFA